MANILGLAWARYSQQLSKKPLPTKAVTAGCLSGASDILAQVSVNPKNRPAPPAFIMSRQHGVSA